MDVFSNFLEGCEVLDVLYCITGLCKEFLVNDYSKALVAVANGAKLAVCIVEVVCVRGKLVGNLRTSEIVCIFTPASYSTFVTNDEERGH